MQFVANYIIKCHIYSHWNHIVLTYIMNKVWNIETKNKSSPATSLIFSLKISAPWPNRLVLAYRRTPSDIWQARSRYNIIVRVSFTTIGARIDPCGTPVKMIMTLLYRCSLLQTIIILESLKILTGSSLTITIIISLVMMLVLC